MDIKRISIISAEPNIPVGGSYHDIMPVFGPLLMGSILKKHGYEVKLFEERLWPMDWDYILSSDAVDFYVMTCTVRRIIEYCRRIRAHNPHVPIIAGGTHPSELPEDTLRFADHVVRKEGDETTLDLLDALQSGRDLNTVMGLSYKRDGKIIHTPDRPFVKDIDIIPDMSIIHRFKSDPPWKLWLRGRKVLNVIQASRGCPFACSFCYGIRQLGMGYRTRSIDSLVEEIKYRNIFTLSALPGRGPQPIPRKRFILLDYDFGSANHVTMFPKQMKPSTLQKEYIRAYRRFNNFRTAWRAIRQGHLLAGVERFAGYLAHRAIIEDIERRYLPLLYKVEEGLYDERERLIEHKLPPQGIIAEGVILPPEEKTLYDPGPQQDLAVSSFDLDGHRHDSVGGALDVAAIPGVVRAHTLEMALRKCYGNQI